MQNGVVSFHQKRGRRQMNSIIDEIVQEMLKVLDNGQLIQLKRVLKKKLGNNKDSGPKRSNESYITDYLAAKQVEGCSEKTINYYQATLKMMFSYLGKHVQKITTEDLRDYLGNYQQSRNSSRVTIDNIRRIFSSFFSWLEDEDIIIKSPVRRIHKVRSSAKVKDTYSDEDLERLRDHCNIDRDVAMIDLLSSTGMRIGELVNLNQNDINFDERECVVLGKGNKQRIVYFDARSKIHLQNYLAKRKDANSALFVSLHVPHQRMSINGIENRLKSLGKKAGIAKVYPHKFRRTLATNAIDKGMPIEQVQKLLGHERIDTTLHYAMVKQSNVKIAHRRYIG
mgnify:FL=1